MNAWSETNNKRIATLLIVVLFLIPLGIAGYSLIYQELNKNHQARINQNNEFAYYAARFLNGYIDEYKTTLQKIAATQAVHQKDTEKIQMLLEQFNLIRPEPSLFWVADDQGDLLAKYPDNYLDKNIKDREFFLETMQGKNFVGGPYIGRVSSLEVIVISVPYYNEGKVAGVIGVSIPLQELNKKLSVIQRRDESHLTLINLRGEVLAHPNLAEFRRIFSYEEYPLSEAFTGNHQEQGYFYYEVDNNKGDNLHSFVKLKEAPWVIVAVQPIESLESQLSNIMGRTLIILTIVGFFVGFIIHYLLLLRDMNNIEKVKQAEKLAVVGELAAGVAHEIRNPLTSIKGFVQLIDMKKGPEVPSYYIETIIDELDRIEQIVGEMVVLAKPAPSEKCPVDLNKLIQDTNNLMASQAEMHEITLRAELIPDMPPIEAVKNQLKQVLINLIKNSIEAIEEKANGQILIKVESHLNTVSISVIDNGKGISEDNLRKLGTPFYSTKDTGTGLGLMTSYRIIQNHGGEITVDSKPGVGTEFIITLPR